MSDVATTRSRADAARALTLDDFPVHRPVTTRWSDNDMYGHLNNAVYYELFDSAINGWQAEHATIDPMTDLTQGVVAESGCSFFAEVGFPSTLVVGLRVARLGQSSVTYELGLFVDPGRRGPPTMPASRRWATGCTSRSMPPRVGRRPSPTICAPCWSRPSRSGREQRDRGRVVGAVGLARRRRARRPRRRRVADRDRRPSRGVRGAGHPGRLRARMPPEPAERARRWSLRRGSPATSGAARDAMADVFLQARRVGGVLALECISDTEFEGLSDLSGSRSRPCSPSAGGRTGTSRPSTAPMRTSRPASMARTSPGAPQTTASRWTPGTTPRAPPRPSPPRRGQLASCATASRRSWGRPPRRASCSAGPPLGSADWSRPVRHPVVWLPRAS